MTGWQTVARREVDTLLGARTAKAGIALVVLVFVLGGYVVPTTVPEPTIVEYDGLLRGGIGFLVPLFGLLLGYRTVVAERAAGRLTLVLSLPHSRAGVVAGKLVGRGLVLAGTITGGVLVGAALVEYPFGAVAPDRLAIYLATTLSLGLTYLVIGVAISTVTASPRRATVLTFGVFFLSVVAWPQLLGPFYQALSYLGLAGDRLPEWALFVHGLEPGMLYRRVLDAYVTGVEQGPYLGSAAPWYLGGGTAAVCLLWWIALPALGGYGRFRGTDL